MLSQAELQARIAAEFLRVGASQQSWDQNFPTQPSVWSPVQTVAGIKPYLSDESVAGYEAIAGPFADEYRSGTGGLRDPDPEIKVGIGRICIPPARAEYISGSWVCTYPDGALQASFGEDEEFGSGPGPLGPGQGSGAPTNPVASPTSTTQTGALPKFIGGKLGRVLYTSIANRNITGVRIGTLPRVVMGDVVPPGYGNVPGIAPGGGNIGGGGNDLIQP